MIDEAAKTYADFVIPASVVNKVDVSRLVAEVERIDSELNAADVRVKTGGEPVQKPILSEQLADFIASNELVVNDARDRSELIRQLRLLKDKAPAVHMTFAVPADRESLRYIVQWVRESVHPQALLQIGLQPSLVAGVYLRTPNRVHDFSLRAALNGQHDALVKELGALRAG
ncbi:MAG: hypothetical protein EOO17_04195 [Chloroflexi bacterium]|nr:MAG: hypothetical protein EOO17_04195 [Chloroflexota bacterium]